MELACIASGTPPSTKRLHNRKRGYNTNADDFSSEALKQQRSISASGSTTFETHQDYPLPEVFNAFLTLSRECSDTPHAPSQSNSLCSQHTQTKCSLYRSHSYMTWHGLTRHLWPQKLQKPEQAVTVRGGEKKREKKIGPINKTVRRHFLELKGHYIVQFSSSVLNCQLLTTAPPRTERGTAVPS